MSISKEVWVRIIVFALAWLNVILGRFLDYELPFVGEELIATTIAAIVSVYTAWKDNAISKGAIAREKRLR